MHKDTCKNEGCMNLSNAPLLRKVYSFGYFPIIANLMLLFYMICTFITTSICLPWLLLAKYYFLHAAVTKCCDQLIFISFCHYACCIHTEYTIIIESICLYCLVLFQFGFAKKQNMWICPSFELTLCNLCVWHPLQGNY